LSNLAQLFAGFGAEAAQKAIDALNRAIANGDNPNTIIQAIEQALQIARYRALTIARTEMLNAYRDAQLTNYQANSDVVRGWVWVADESDRTCMACLMESGSEHTLDEEMDTHPNCRCAMAPLTNSWADILGPLGIDTSGIEETSIDIPPGEDWFNSQDAATQKAMMGPGAYEAWQQGDFALSDIVGYRADGAIYVKPLKELVK
jgi:SPP1 gp7 family putative phage head morphogenesis protein